MQYDFNQAALVLLRCYDKNNIPNNVIINDEMLKLIFSLSFSSNKE